MLGVIVSGVEQTHYEVLGLSRGARVSEIRAAYRALAKTYHPDVSKARGAAERFARIARAYEVLGDVKLRAAYDAQLEQRESAAGSDTRRAHYSWENIAARRPTGPAAARRAAGEATGGSELDELYDTFFGPIAESAADERSERKRRSDR
jgi:DnaJ-class molecular chaperone